MDYIPHSESLVFTFGGKRGTFFQGLKISFTKYLGSSSGLLVIANIQTPFFYPPPLRYRLYCPNHVNFHVVTMPVYSTVLVLILYGNGFSQLDCSKIKKNLSFVS